MLNTSWSMAVIFLVLLCKIYIWWQLHDITYLYLNDFIFYNMLKNQLYKNCWYVDNNMLT